MSHYGSDSDFSNYYSTLVLWMQRAETAQRLLSQEPHWEWRPELHALMVFPSTKVFSGSVMVKYVSTEVYDIDPVKRTDPPNDLRRMSAAELDILLKCFEAYAKIRLGRVRGKYTDGMPSAGGKSMLDGDMLISEARDDLERLTEKLNHFSPVPLLTG